LAVLRERSAHSRRIEGKAGPWRKGTLFLIVRCWMTTTRQRFKIPKKGPKEVPTTKNKFDL
jgi:hypothetical protein